MLTKTMTRARVLEMRRSRVREARKQGITYYQYMRKAHAKRKALQKQRRQPRQVRSMPTPRYKTGTSHVGRATRKHFIATPVTARIPSKIIWFDTQEQQREWKKLKRLL